MFLLDEENVLLHSFNTSIDAQSHLVFDTYAKVTRIPPIKAHNMNSLYFCQLPISLLDVNITYNLQGLSWEFETVGANH